MVNASGNLVATLEAQSSATVSHELMPDGAYASKHIIDVTVTAPALVDPHMSGNLHTHIFVTDYRRWVVEYLTSCKTAIDAGVDERQVRIAEQQADGMVRAVTAAFEALRSKRTQLPARCTLWQETCGIGGPCAA